MTPQYAFTEFFIPLSQIFILIAGLLILVFGVTSTASNLTHSPKETIKGLVGVLLLIALVFVVWTTSSGELVGVFKTARYSHITENIMKIVTTGVWTSMVLILGALAITALTEFVNLFR